MNREVAKTTYQHDGTPEEWVQRLLAKEPCVPDGHVFCWNGVSNTAYLYEAAMRYIQMGQTELKDAQCMLGKQAYRAGMKSAHCFAYVLNEILPQWTFRPHLLTDTTEQDIYGHYCLARAVAYDAVGEADMECTDSAKAVAAANASHLYTVAAHLIDGDVSNLVARAQHAVGKALVVRSRGLLAAWDRDEDANGAASALACLQEASNRFALARKGDCQDQLQYAYDRNQVHWQEPVLPDWSKLLRVQITKL